MEVDFYAVPGPLTELTVEQTEVIRGLAMGSADLCRVAQGLLVAPLDAAAAGLSGQRLSERTIRPATSLLARALELSGAPLDQPRAAELRVVGTCRHFALMATALMRAVDLPARARCGFAAYFAPPRKVDHWIVEYWSDEDRRWVRLDPEYLDRPTPAGARADDLRSDEFLTAGEAWQLIRSGGDDPEHFGVFGTDNWGSGEIRGNAMRDLASLVAKTEMLPWDAWGPMEDSYSGKTGDDFDRLVDDLAAACGSGDERSLERVYRQLAVPASMIS